MRNDLFVAHESIYRYLQRLCSGRAVVDAGCGTGYGSRLLAEAGARTVLGIDIDVHNIRFAAARYPAPGVRFVVGDLHHLDSIVDAADLVVASNALEHLERPEVFLEAALRIVGDGTVIIAVPPIFSAADELVHSGIHYHRANRSVGEWFDLSAERGWQVQPFAHRAAAGDLHIDFASPLPSKLTTGDFVVEESSREDMYRRGAITAIFALRRGARIKAE